MNDSAWQGNDKGGKVNQPLPPLGPSPPATPTPDPVRREMDRIARQLDGLSKSLKRLTRETI